MVSTDSAGTVTKLPRAWSDGDQTALERLTPLVEAELRRLARVTFEETLVTYAEPDVDLLRELKGQKP